MDWGVRDVQALHYPLSVDQERTYFTKFSKISASYFHIFFRSEDLDELEVYGADTKGTELASYSFEVRTLYEFFA
jgi:hypothetical protein